MAKFLTLLICALVLTVGPAFRPAPPAISQPWFAGASSWTTPIPSGHPLDAKSSDYIADIQASLKSTGQSYMGIGATSNAIPLWATTDSTPTTTVTFDGSSAYQANWDYAVSQSWHKVPIPAGASPSEGPDHWATFISESYIWDFYMAVKTGSAWQVRIVRRWDRSGTGSPQPDDGLGRSRACPGSAVNGQITYNEVVTTGHINHALSFSYNGQRLCPGSWGCTQGTDNTCYPCSVTMAGSTDRLNALPLGKRLQLDPTINVNAISGLSAYGRVVAHALQEYGAILVDSSGDAFVTCEGKNVNWDGVLAYDTLNVSGINSWNNFRVVTPVYPSSISNCDINSDGSVNDADVTFLLDIILGRNTWSKGDLNSDGVKDVRDLQILLSVIAGRATCP